MDMKTQKDKHNLEVPSELKKNTETNILITLSVEHQ